jgi:hypothetical protein
LSPPATPPSLVNSDHLSQTVTLSSPKRHAAIKPVLIEDEIYPHGNKKNYKKVGMLISKGVNFGRDVWEGPLGGLFYYNSNNNRSTIANKGSIKFNQLR